MDPFFISTAFLAAWLICLLLNNSFKNEDIKELEAQLSNSSPNSPSGPYMRTVSHYEEVKMSTMQEWFWYRDNNDPKRIVVPYVEVFIQTMGTEQIVAKFKTDDPNHDDLLHKAWAKAEDRISTYESLV